MSKIYKGHSKAVQSICTKECMDNRYRQNTLYWFGNIASMFPISPTMFQQVNGELLNIYSTNVADVTMQHYNATL